MEMFRQKIDKFLTFNRGNGKRGVAIYLAAVTMVMVLGIAIGVSLLSTYQLKNLNESGASVIAFAAAESGIEWSLANPTVVVAGYTSPGEVSLSNGATYKVKSEACGSYLCITSVGSYPGTQRAIRVQL